MKKIFCLLLILCFGLVGCSNSVARKGADLPKSDEEYLKAMHTKMLEINKCISKEDYVGAENHIEEIKSTYASNTNEAAIIVTIETYYNDIEENISYEEYIEKTKELSFLYNNKAIDKITLSEEDFAKMKINVDL